MIRTLPALRARRLSRDFSELVGRRSDPVVRVGLEHEYRVLVSTGPLDFSAAMHALDLPGRSLDPADPNAFLLDCGCVITADGGEAEVAIPPIGFDTTLIRKVEEAAARARMHLEDALPKGALLQGYSTHVNVSVPDRRVDAVARLFVQRFAAAVMLLLDRRTSPGLLVRPRPNRLEVGGDHAQGPALRAAVAMILGGALACERVARPPLRADRILPPALDVRAERAQARFGWYVDRRAFGPDLYEEGREARLPLLDGGTITAQRWLEGSWDVARSTLEGLGSIEGLEAEDRMVAADIPIPTEDESVVIDDRVRPGGGPHCRDWHGSGSPAAGPGMPAHRPGFRVRPVAATWDATVFRIDAGQGSRRAFACVPRPLVASFGRRVDAGDLDPTIQAYLSGRRSRRALASARQTRDPGLYDVMPDPAAILPAERDPETGLKMPPIGSKAQRPGKRRSRPQQDRPSHPGPPAVAPITPALDGIRPAATKAGRSWRPFAIVGAAVLLVAVGLPFAIAQLGGDGGQDAATPTVQPTAAEPTLTSSPVSPPAPSPSPSPVPTTPEAVMFSAEDLCGLVLSEQDAPSGMSPMAGLEQEPNECRTGFWAADFLPRVFSAAFLFTDAEEAQAEAEALRDSEVGFIDGAVQIDAPLGEGSFGLIRQYEPSATEIAYGIVSYYWAVGNVVLNVSYNADQKVDQGDVQPLAEIMQAHAGELS